MIVDVAFEDGSVSLCRIEHELNAVCGYYDVTDVEDTGLYRKVAEGIYEPISDSDEDYEMSTDEESDSDISLDDEE